MLSLLQTKYFQFVEHSRQEGFLSACKIALYKYEEIVPTVKDLDTLRPTPPISMGELPIFDLGPENFHSHDLNYSQRSRRARAASHFCRGYRNFALVKDGRVVADVWYVTRENARSPSIHPHLTWFGLRLAAEDVYVFDLHVNVDQRGGGLATNFHGRVLEILRDRGFHRAYGFFSTKNIPALWMHRLIGYRELPRCIVRRLIFFETAHAKAENKVEKQNTATRTTS